MFNLEIQGTSNIMGIEVPNIIGGFGEGQKSMLARDIANVHSYSGVGKVNDLIDSHRDEFEDEIDIIDLKEEKYKDFVMLLRDNGILTQNSINRSEHIYLLSEQGYMLLVGFMEGEKAKQVRKQLRREYFAMKQIIQENPIERALTRVVNSGLSEEMDILLEEQARKTIEIEAPKYFNKGIKRGIEQGQDMAWNEANKIIADLKNGEEKTATLEQLASTLNNYFWKLEIETDIVTTDINNLLVDKGLLTPKKFPKLKNKNGHKEYVYDIYGEQVLESRYHKQPTEKFMNEFVLKGLAQTREIDFRGKIEITFTVDCIDKFVELFKEKFEQERKSKELEGQLELPF